MKPGHSDEWRKKKKNTVLIERVGTDITHFLKYLLIDRVIHCLAVHCATQSIILS